MKAQDKRQKHKIVLIWFHKLLMPFAGVKIHFQHGCSPVYQFL